MAIQRGLRSLDVEGWSLEYEDSFLAREKIAHSVKTRIYCPTYGGRPFEHASRFC